MLVLNALPPLLAAYHLIVEPVAAKFATVPLLQKAWAALPVGAAGSPVTVMVRDVEFDPPAFVAVSCTVYVPAAVNCTTGEVDVDDVLETYEWVPGVMDHE